MNIDEYLEYKRLDYLRSEHSTPLSSRLKTKMKARTLLLLLAFIGIVAVIRSQEGKFYCGRSLARALALLCENGMLIKRSEPYSAMMPHQQEVSYQWPWITPHRAHNLDRGKRNGVASECCEKPCTVDELLSYCA